MLITMKEASITVRISPEFKQKCDSLFNQLGMNTSAAISIFLHQAVRDQSMPFTPSLRTVDQDGIASKLPVVGRFDLSGNTILPSELDNPEDDVYEQLL